MGNKGARKKGSFAHDYDNHVMWNTHINLSDADLDAIADAGKIELSAQRKSDLKAEIETYASLAEAEKDAPSIGGSGRSNDFLDQHLQRLAQIYRDSGGIISLGRKNPSREHPRGTADSPFFNYCLAINEILPKELKRSFNGGPSDGLAMSVRRAVQKNK